MHQVRMIGLFFVAVFVAMGCQPSTTTAPNGHTASTNNDSSNRVPTTSSNPDELATGARSEREYWDAIFFDDSKVGHVHTVYATIGDQKEQKQKISAESYLKMKRFGETMTHSLTYSSVETSDGQVIRFESSMRNGQGGDAGVPLETVGEIRGGQLELQLTTLGKTQKETRPWNGETGGFFALDQSLQKSPLQPGEQRSLQALAPGFNQVAEIELRAGDWEPVELLDKTAQLLRVDCTMTLGQNPIDQVLWMSRDGEIMKSVMPSLRQTSYRTTKEFAVGGETGKFDLGETTIVPVEPAVMKAHEAKSITYLAEFQRGSARGAFAEGGSQRVRYLDDNTAELTVRSVRPADDLGTEFPVEAPPAEADRRANNLIQSDDAEVIRLANEFAKDESDPWKLAVALEKGTEEFVRDKNFSQALSSAAEVARSHEGDCTEHAVLLAAVCRARGIPSRVAIGLVYSPSSGGFAYHMWTLAWIQDRWIPLDATRGDGGIGGGHLMVAQSNLDGTDSLAAFLPVLRLIGNVTLKVQDIQ